MSLVSFIPELWSARLLKNLEEAHVATAFVNRDYEGVIKNQGDTVHVNTLGPVTIKDYDSTAKANGIDAPQTLDTTDQTLVIDCAKYFNFKLDDIDRVQSSGPLMDQAMHNAAFGIAHEVDTKIFETISKAVPEGHIVGNNSTTITADNVWGLLIKLRGILNKANAPKDGRKIACSTDVVGVILNDARFVKTGSEQAEARIANGLVRRACGFDIYETEDAPEGEILATVPMATSFAEQITETEGYRPENGFADAIKGLNVYGVKTFYANATAKAVYKTKNYIAVEEPTGNPKTKGYFELVDGWYVASTDTSVDSDKTYYEVEA